MPATIAGLIGTVEMAKIIGYNLDTARRWCSKGVIHVHRRGGPKGVDLLSYRGSVEVRKEIFEYLRSGRNGRDMTLERIGKLLTQACGDDDAFIVERLKADKSVSQIYEELLPVVKQLSH
jgi:hypothetical protein